MLDSISRAWLVKPMVTDFVRNVVGEIRCRVYDWKHGVHTCGNVNLTGLTLVGNNRSYGVHYHPSHPKFLLQEFSKLNIDYNQFTFIDFGAGKGRVLLAASEFPFHRIIGVEFASELTAIACENIKRYRSATQKCTNVECLNIDAAEFEFPSGPLVLYLFNPFGPNVLRPLMQNLQRSLDADLRDVLLIYMSPFHGDLIEQETALRCIAHDTYHNLYSYSIPE